MFKIFKRLAAMLMVIATLVSMAACQQNNANNGLDPEAQKVQNTQAVTVGQHTLSAVELNYFFMDAVVEWYGNNSGIAYLLGFDANKPLNEQVISATTGETWADSFMKTAMDNIRSTYALYDLAIASGFKLSPAQQAEVDNLIKDLNETLEAYAEYYEQMGFTYPYANAGEYLHTVYGAGADEETYQHYYEVCTISDAFYTYYTESLTYDNKTLREFEADKYGQYSSYHYQAYFVDLKNYDSAEQALADAQLLINGNYADKTAFDDAIKALAINENKNSAKLSEAYENALYNKISTYYAQWLAEAGRVSGDMQMFAKEDDKGNVQGYYVVRFESANDNNFTLKNVRHLLVAFKGGTFNAVTGVTTYTDAEKEAARVQAEKYMLQFLTGADTELRFADMANAYSDDGDGTTGGLYENIYPGLMVDAFEEWCYSPKRHAGDVELIQTEYGWHVMYFVEHTSYTFRDYLLTNDLRARDVNAWYEGLLESAKLELVDDSYVNKALILSKM